MVREILRDDKRQKNGRLKGGRSKLLAGTGLVGDYSENVVELGEGQHFPGMVGGINENHFATAAAKFGEERDKDANTSAVDVPDFGEVDGAVGDDLAEVVVHGLEELVGIGAADEVASEANEEDTVLDSAGAGHAGEAVFRAAAWARQSPQMP